MKQPCVYSLASGWNGTLYIGVTSDLVARIHQHKNDTVLGFTSKYGVHDLAWYEQHDTMDSAITGERAIKRWKREWKVRLIERRIRSGSISIRRSSDALGGKSWIPAFAGMTDP